MNQSLAQTEAFVQAMKNDTSFSSLPETTTLIICPSFLHLDILAQALSTTPITLGAQTCSPYPPGPYTGQVSANMLAEVNCTYCLIGHSERRSLCGETDVQVLEQCQQLLNNKITPVICIGESEKEYAAGATTIILKQQLKLLINAYKKISAATIFIAYEPVWAIGSGNIPTEEELSKIFLWLKNRIEKELPLATPFFLYGGSVNEKNSLQLKKINYLDGLLIGNASLDFKKFKNIVL